MKAIALPPDEQPAGADLPAPSASARPPGRWGVRPAEPRWARPALFALLALTAVAYLWDLSASGWANSFYSAAVQAGTRSWKAFFFGSFDAAGFITVDKPPVALWAMELPARVFGVNSWTLLAPEALAGVATVAVVYATVRRWFGSGAGLLAATVTALTPVAALMFRFNNPDALLTLLLAGAAYATVRAVEDGRTRWLVLASVLVGTGFLTKMLQAFLVVPALAGVYLAAGPGRVGKRLRQLAVAAVALLVSAGWWVAAVQLTPAADRPYIGGSQDNSLVNLIVGYNGFGRLTGNETGSVGGGGATGSRWGITGITRLFGADMGTQISWLLPAALILLAAGVVLTRRAGRTDRTRAALGLWGGWLVLTGAVFSFGQGIIHPYYTVVLAPAVGAVVGIGATRLWAGRRDLSHRAVLAAAVAGTAVWSFVLLRRTPDWYPALRAAVLVGGLAAAAALVCLPRLRTRPARAAVAAAAAVASLAGPAAYTADTVATPHTGAIPSAGPVSTGLPGGFGPRGRGGPAGAAGGAALGPGSGGRFGAPGGMLVPPRNFGPAGGPGRGPVRAGGAGGLLDGSRPGAAIVSLLEAGASGYTWAAATVGANQAAGYQLATSLPVMAIGGFNGTDPTPTLAQFERYVLQGRIHYFIAGGGGIGGGPAGVAGGAGGPGGATAGASTSAQITSWVESHFTATTVGGLTVYDLSAP